MKKILLFLLIVSTKSFCQNLVSAEYFVDTDPGVGLAIPITGLSGAQSSFNINLTAPSVGFHVLGVRAKDSNGNWGLYEKSMVYVSSSTANKPNITDAEYFIDTDPGVGLANPIAVTDGATPTFVLNFAAPVAGFHTIAIRAKDVDGNWGLYEKNMVYVSSSTANKPNITDAEYFIDTDPGVGLANSVAVIDGAAPTFVVNFTAPATGFHTLAIRAKDAAGNWGLYEKGLVYVSSSTTNNPNITDAEYFIDLDPGVGNGVPVAVIDGQITPFSVNLTSNTVGFHTVAIRVKDANGVWGLFEKGMIYVSPTATNAGDITKGEYFFDNDPGPGNGFPLTTPVGQNFAQNFNLNVPRTLANGEHIVAIRMFDDWGLTDTKTFTVDGVALPLNLLNFSTKLEKNTAFLNWETAEEKGVSHFEIERSDAQINFKKIGQITAKNNTEKQTYDYTDENLAEGVFYYRLKMVDLDGAYSYSPIRSILVKNAESQLKVYPSPAENVVTVDLLKNEPIIKAEIFSLTGASLRSERFVESDKIEMNVNSLPSGFYVIRITLKDGAKEVKFLKK